MREFRQTALDISNRPDALRWIVRCSIALVSIVGMLSTTFNRALAAEDDSQAGSLDRRFELIADRYLEARFALFPVWATQVGDHRFDGRLDRLGEAARNEELRLYQSFLVALEEIEVGQLSRANQVDHALLEHQLRSKQWRLQTLREWAWNPLIHIGLAGQSFYGLMARDFAPIESRLARAAERLEQFPRFLEQARGSLETVRVPKIHAETAAGIKVSIHPKTGRVKYASAHDRRRSFGERWAQLVMPQVLMELMRHESIETTMRYYVGRNAEMTADTLWLAYSQQRSLAEGTTLGTTSPKSR